MATFCCMCICACKLLRNLKPQHARPAPCRTTTLPQSSRAVHTRQSSDCQAVASHDRKVPMACTDSIGGRSAAAWCHPFLLGPLQHSCWGRPLRIVYAGASSVYIHTQERHGLAGKHTYDVCCKHVNSADIHPSPPGDPTDLTHPPCCPTPLACALFSTGRNDTTPPWAQSVSTLSPQVTVHYQPRRVFRPMSVGTDVLPGPGVHRPPAPTWPQQHAPHIAWRRAAAVPVSQHPCCWTAPPAAHPYTRQLVDAFTRSSHQNNDTAHSQVTLS